MHALTWNKYDAFPAASVIVRGAHEIIQVFSIRTLSPKILINVLTLIIY